jgi:iron complex outermembrane recepter protein
VASRQKNIAAVVVLMFAGMAARAQVESQSQPEDTSVQIAEIVVTAQKRSERLQDVPITVSAFDAATMSAIGVTDAANLPEVTPGLIVNQEIFAPLFAIRGVGNQNAAVVGAEPAVSLYVDGVYFPAANGAIFDFNNLERVEVLDGPQGTLFGRNAIGGVIQVITKTPSQTPHIDFDVGYANFNTTRFDLYATGGITASLAADVAIHYEDQADGWGVNLFNGDPIFRTRDVGVRSKWLLTLDDTRVTLSATYNHLVTDVAAGYYIYPGYKALDGRIGPPGGFYDIDSNTQPKVFVTSYGGSITVEQDLHWASLKSITAFNRTIPAFPSFDQDATPLNIVNSPSFAREHTVTQELQLGSPEGSALKWLTGLYYFNDHAGYDPAGGNGTAYDPLSVAINTLQYTASYAGFAQATATILPATNLTLGVRYTSDHRHIVGQTDTTVNATGLPGPVLGTGNQEAGWDKTTFRASLDHHFTDDILTYISFNRGFQSGVFNTYDASAPAVKPEVLDASEIGLKTEFLNKRLIFNSAAYFYKFTNMQLQKTIDGSAILENAASAHIKGLDASIDLIPVRNLTLRVNASYIDSEFTSYPDAPVNVPAVGGGLATVTGNDTGNQLPYAPKYSFNVGGDYAVPTSRGNYSFSINYAYTDALFINPDNLIKQPGFGLLNGSITWASLDGKWDARLWGKNLTETHTYLYSLEQALGPTFAPAAPRTVGITLGTHW